MITTTSNPPRALLDALADSLAYPRPESTCTAARKAALLLDSDEHPELAAALHELADGISEDYRTQEEAYSRLFDLQPVCTLELGYHLFGERYERGLLLAGLRGELREAGVPEGSELPDYLPSLLRLLSRVDAERRGLLIAIVILPALRKMKRIASSKRTSWFKILCELSAVLEPSTSVEHVNDYLNLSRSIVAAKFQRPADNGTTTSAAKGASSENCCGFSTGGTEQ